jgi:hypothetical protein
LACSYYFNALFDLQLGGYATEPVHRAAAEMSVLFVPVAQKSDYVLLDAIPHDSYWEYLHSLGLDLPTPLYSETCTTDSIGCAWGWNKNAVERLMHMGARCSHPDLSKVAFVNSRKFCDTIAQKYHLGIPGSRFCPAIEDVESVIKKRDFPFPCVIKPAYGGSGFGFIFIDSPESYNDSIRNRISDHLAHGGVAIEPWLDRRHDFATTFTILPNGAIDSLRHHRSHTNRAGAFFGIYLYKNDQILKRWIDNLDKAAEIIAQALYKHGFTGPAGFDSFTWVDNAQKAQLVPLVEINARYSMAVTAYALRSRFGIQQPCYFRTISRRRCTLPSSYSALKEQFGSSLFQPAKATGILPVTPLRIGLENAQINQPVRNTFFISAPTENELFALDNKLRRYVAKKNVPD